MKRPPSKHNDTDTPVLIADVTVTHVLALMLISQVICLDYIIFGGQSELCLSYSAYWI